jgi:hypothetical protein
MRLLSSLGGGLAYLVLCATPALAEAPPSPLRLIPAEADLLVQVHDPRRLAETIVGLDTLKQLLAFPAVREQIDSTQARRGRQLLAYFERQLGGKWPDLLDRLAGGGLALGLKFANGVPALVVVQAKEEALLEKFVKHLLIVVEGELARQESKEKITRSTYHGIAVAGLGKGFCLARAGTALLLSNNPKALRRGLDLHLGREKKSLADTPSVVEAAKLLPREPLANLWLNMHTVQKAPEAKDLYKTPRENFVLTLGFANYLDVLGRTPFLAGGLYRDKDGFLLTVRAPRGRKGMRDDAALQIAPAGQPAARQPLEPRGVLYGSSDYFDFAKLWNDRGKLFTPMQVQAFERFDKTSGRFLFGTRVSQLLGDAGPYTRFLVVNQPKVGYKSTPKVPIPAFAYVVELRNPERFGRSMGTILRAGGFLARFGEAQIKLVEEKHKGIDVVGYRFDEKVPLKGDVNDIRFNFSPCFARVGNQFVLCSTLELCRELVELLQQEQKAPKPGLPVRVSNRIYAAGVADLLASYEDQFIAQTILDQAVPPGEAREQVRNFIALVRKLGHVSVEEGLTDEETRWEVRFGAGK